jgi:hypothetical protein
LLLSTKMIDNIELYHSKVGFDDAEIIKFMIKSWIIRYVSTYEISLCLINEVMELGYTGKTITKTNLENNKHIRNNSQLEGIRKKISELVQKKLTGSMSKSSEKKDSGANFTGEMNPDSTNELSWYELQKKWRLYEDDNNDEIDKDLLNVGITKEMRQMNDEITLAIIELLDFLNPIYQDKFEELKK